MAFEVRNFFAFNQLLSPHSDGIQENLTFFNNRLKKKVVQMKKVNSGGSFTELYGIKGLFINDINFVRLTDPIDTFILQSLGWPN